MKIRSTDCVNAIIHFFYPSYCLHCDGPLEKKNHLLCPPCYEQIEWIEMSKRCVHCAGPVPCLPCKKSPRPIRPHLSLFERCGPILPLYNNFLKSKKPAALASLLLLTLSRSSFPIPDVIVPGTSKLFPKKEPAYLLASHLARLLKRPCLHLSSSLQDKTVLLLTPVLTQAEELLNQIRFLKGTFPTKIYSLALIDNRSESENMGQG